MNHDPQRVGFVMAAFLESIRVIAFVVAVAAGIVVPCGQSLLAVEQSEDILVLGRKSLPADQVPCQRIPLGMPDDYKPCVARLPDGTLLLTCFHQHRRDGGKVMEQTLLFRSADGGLSWSSPEELPLLGREPYLSVLSDGTVFLTGHLLANDVRNMHGYTHGYLHRSSDAGRTWQTIRLDSSELGKPGASNHTSRNVLELADGALLLGVDLDGGGGPYFAWRSTDRGATWQRDRVCRPEGFQSVYGFFGGETWLWQTRGGKIIAVVRVDSREFPIAGRPSVPGTEGDQEDHEMLWESDDQGLSFRRVSDWGDYGQMYPSLLRLRDGRLLYTFTVRALHPPLGVQALLGAEQEDGFAFDFHADRLVIDGQTPIGKPQGGGFGPTVELDDGTLVTSYSYRGADDKTHIEVARWRLP
jgi:hypothetical protein